MNTVLSILFGDSQAEEFFNTYRCYSFALHKCSDVVRETLSHGGKLLLPQSALRILTAGPDSTSTGSRGPMIFNISANSQHVIVGVQEFTAPEGAVLAPNWLMRQLRIVDGDIVRVAEEPNNLPPGQFARLLSHGGFLEAASDPKAALERLLRGFTCLSVGNKLELELNGRTYQLDVVELRPRHQVCVVDCDLSVEFVEEKPKSKLQIPEAVRETRVKEPTPTDSYKVHNSGAAWGTSPAGAVNCDSFPDLGVRLDSLMTSLPSAPERSSASDAPSHHSSSRAVQPNMAYTWGSLSYPQHHRFLSSYGKGIFGVA